MDVSKTLNQNKLKKKLFHVLIILVSSVTAIVIISYIFLRQAEFGVDKFLKIGLKEIVYSHEAANIFSQSQSNIRELMIEYEKQRSDEVSLSKSSLKNENEKLNDIFDKWIEIIKTSLKKLPENKRHVKKKYLDQVIFFKKQVDNYYENMNFFMIAHDQKKHKRMDDIFEKNLEPIYRSTLSTIDKIQAHVMRKSIYNLTAVSREIFLSTISTFSLILLVILISISYGYSLIKNIVKQFSLYIDQIKENDSKLLHMTRHDILTGLPNRLFFSEELNRIISLASRIQQKFAVLMIDIDNFKTINDTYGHQVGDSLLIQIAKRKTEMLRIEDIAARFGGDEFCIILSNLASFDDSCRIAGKLIKYLAVPYTVMGRSIEITVSIGIANYPDSADTITELMKSADIALYYAKSSGRNNYQLFTDQIGKVYHENLRLEALLKQAVAKNQFYIEYQPVYFMDNHILGIEALARWEDDELGIVPPEVFIRIAEDHGLINSIGSWILKIACEEFSKYCLPEYPNLKLFINISPKQLTEDFFVDLTSTLSVCKISHENIVIELTETDIMQVTEDLEYLLSKLKNSGISIAVDDFGTGYSSLSRLRSLPINILKIDSSFINDICSSENDRVIVSSILSLANNLEIMPVVEGVETKEQLDFLISIGCKNIQGFIFSKPERIHEIKKLLDEARGD